MSEEAKRIINDLNNLLGMDTEHLVRIGLINERQAKRWLVKQLYFKYAKEGNTLEKTGRTYGDIKNELSVEYDISVSTIEKLVYRGN
jgi:hypothetical protein